MCRQDQHRDAAGRGVNRARDILQIATPLVWVGMVLGISVLETPLKFRAPGITRALGLGIGRLVFRALNLTELVLLTVCTLALLGASPSRWVVALTASLWAVLLVQLLGLRPALDRRASLIIDGATPPRSSLHHPYIALEGLKILSLPTLATLLLFTVLP